MGRVTWPVEECSVCGGSGGGGEHSTTPHCKHPGLTSTMMGQKVGGVWRISLLSSRTLPDCPLQFSATTYDCWPDCLF